MGVMGTVKHEVEGVELALRFWGAECRRNMSGNLMRSIARGFERSDTAKAMHHGKAKAFVDMTYTFSPYCWKVKQHVSETCAES